MKEYYIDKFSVGYPKFISTIKELVGEDELSKVLKQVEVTGQTVISGTVFSCIDEGVELVKESGLELMDFRKCIPVPKTWAIIKDRFGMDTDKKHYDLINNSQGYDVNTGYIYVFLRRKKNKKIFKICIGKEESLCGKRN